MNNAVERSVQLFKITQHPLRCLSEIDPCNLKKSLIHRSEDVDPPRLSIEEGASWEKQ